MNLRDVEILTVEKMQEHGLHDWEFKWHSSIRRFGTCHYYKKRISLSKQLCEANEIGPVLDTVLHEIAHALVGKGHSHDEVWQAKCREIGAAPITKWNTHDDRGYVLAEKHGYIAVCVCGGKFQRARIPKGRWFCHCQKDKETKVFLEFKKP